MGIDAEKVTQITVFWDSLFILPKRRAFLSFVSETEGRICEEAEELCRTMDMNYSCSKNNIRIVHK